MLLEVEEIAVRFRNGALGVLSIGSSTSSRCSLTVGRWSRVDSAAASSKCSLSGGARIAAGLADSR